MTTTTTANAGTVTTAREGGGGDRQQCDIVVVITVVAAVSNGSIPQHLPTPGPFCGSPLSFDLQSKQHKKQVV